MFQWRNVKSIMMIFEIARIQLDNEMDLILAHRRSMKLAELAGLSLSSQTTIATAVSEIARGVLETQQGGLLKLSIKTDDRDQYIVASLSSKFHKGQAQNTGVSYAKKLVSNITVSVSGDMTVVEIQYFFSSPTRIDNLKIDEWRYIYRNEPSFSPYDELKRKNEQLQDMSMKLQRSENDHRTLTNSLPLVIFSVDERGNLLYANEWLHELTGESVTGQEAWDWTKIIHQSDYDGFAFLLSCLQNATDMNLTTQCRIRNKSGEYTWHQVTLSPLKGDSPGQQYWSGYMVDIHNQKMLEETLKDNVELKKAQEKLNANQEILEKYIQDLNQTNAELQQFAYVTSHDLQEPVRKMMYYSDSLLRRSDKLDENEKIRMVTKINQASVRMRNLIHDTLQFARVGKESITFETVSLNVLMKDVLQELDSLIASKNATIFLGEMPEIPGNYGLLGQVFSNLITNSLKFVRPDQRPEVHVNANTEDQFVEISIADNGIGFNEEYKLQIFALFQRLHNKEVYDGTGLGLAICKKIVHLHRGSIRASSIEGQGAVFYVRLPMLKNIGHD